MKKLYSLFPYISHSEQSTSECAQKLAELIKNDENSPKILCLRGMLGSGKTFFIKEFAKFLGIRHLDVKSPTYTYMRIYKSDDKKTTINHFDYYRIESMDDLMIEEFLEISQSKDSYCLIEWPEKIMPYIDNYIELDFAVVDEHTRMILCKYMKKSENVLLKEIYTYLKDAFTPKHVVSHCEKVAAVSYRIALSMLEKGIEVDIYKVLQAGLLHDILRIVDFDDYTDLIKEHSTESSKVWEKQSEKYNDIDHCEAGYLYLKEKGLDEIAKIVRNHNFEAIEHEELFTIEDKILTYADKRVMHNIIVNMDERFRDGLKRYNPNSENMEYIEMLHKKYFALEEELFSKIDITPKDITDDLNLDAVLNL